MKKRGRLIIYPRFQKKVLWIQLGVLAAAFGVVALAAWFSYQTLGRQGLEAGLSTGHVYFKFVDYHYGILFQALAGAFVLAGLLSTIAFLTLSHRLAGPIIRMKDLLEKIAENPATAREEIRFREGDFFEDLPPAINRALRAVGDHRDRNGSPTTARTPS